MIWSILSRVCSLALKERWVNFQVLIALLIKKSDGIRANILHFLTSRIVQKCGLVRFRTYGQIVKRLVLLLNRWEVQITRLLIQIARYNGCICFRHNKFMSTSLALNLTRVWLVQGLTDDLVMVYLQNSALVGVLQGSLEIFGDLFLAKLSLHTVNNGHNSFNIAIKDVTFL